MVPYQTPGWRQFPLGRPVLCFAFGIWMQDVIQFPFAAAWFCALLGCCALLRPRWADAALALALFFAGATRLSLASTPWSPNDLRNLLPPSETLVSIQGILLETPVERALVQSGKTNFSTSARVVVDALRSDGSIWHSAMGEIVVSSRGRLNDTFRGGRTITLDGLMTPPPEAQMPGGFDYRAYLARNNVFFQLRNEAPRDWRLFNPAQTNTLSLTDRFQDWGRHTMIRGLPEEDEIIRLLWAMTLGWKGGLSSDQQEPFMRSGTIHVFAISGLHIALIAGIFIGVGCVCGFPRSWAGFFAMPVVWAYTGLTGWQASAIRSAVMMSVVVAGWMIQRPWNLINSLAIAGLILLVWDPQQLFQAGFQLSFIVVFSLATLGPVFQEWFQRWMSTEILVPGGRRSWWQERRSQAGHALAMNLSVAAAAWVGSLPCVVHYFHVFNPISLVANLIVVPLSTIALASSVASLACGSWAPALTELFNHSSWFWMKLMVVASRYSAAFPGGCWNAASPGWMGFTIYYLALLSGVGRSLIRIVARRKLDLLLTSLILLRCGESVHDWNTTHITLLPRRSGTTLWLEAPGWDGNWLIDPGDERTTHLQTTPFLCAAGVNRIEHLAISQGITGAMGGASLLESQFRIRSRFAPGVPLRSTAWRSWHALLDQSGRPCIPLVQGDHADPWIVLYPSSNGGSSTSEESPLVLKGWFSDVSVLWLPALSPTGQNVLVNSDLDLSADLIVAGIPSKGVVLSDALLRRVHPSVGILVDMGSPAAKRNAEEQAGRILRSGGEWFRLSETGALTIELKSGRIRVRPSKPRRLPPPKTASEDVPTNDVSP